MSGSSTRSVRRRWAISLLLLTFVAFVPPGGWRPAAGADGGFAKDTVTVTNFVPDARVSDTKDPSFVLNPLSSDSVTWERSDFEWIGWGQYERRYVLSSDGGTWSARLVTWNGGTGTDGWATCEVERRAGEGWDDDKAAPFGCQASSAGAYDDRDVQVDIFPVGPDIVIPADSAKGAEIARWLDAACEKTTLGSHCTSVPYDEPPTVFDAKLTDRPLLVSCHLGPRKSLEAGFTSADSDDLKLGADLKQHVYSSQTIGGRLNVGVSAGLAFSFQQEFGVDAIKAVVVAGTRFGYKYSSEIGENDTGGVTDQVTAGPNQYNEHWLERKIAISRHKFTFSTPGSDVVLDDLELSSPAASDLDPEIASGTTSHNNNPEVLAGMCPGPATSTDWEDTPSDGDLGRSTTMRVRVTPAPVASDEDQATLPPPTGRLNIYQGEYPLCVNVPVVDGLAMCSKTLRPRAPGPNVMTALYSGDQNWGPSHARTVVGRGRWDRPGPPLRIVEDSEDAARLVTEVVDNRTCRAGWMCEIEVVNSLPSHTAYKPMTVSVAGVDHFLEVKSCGPDAQARFLGFESSRWENEGHGAYIGSYVGGGVSGAGVSWTGRVEMETNVEYTKSTTDVDGVQNMMWARAYSYARAEQALPVSDQIVNVIVNTGAETLVVEGRHVRRPLESSAPIFRAVSRPVTPDDCVAVATTTRVQQSPPSLPGPVTLTAEVSVAPNGRPEDATIPPADALEPISAGTMTFFAGPRLLCARVPVDEGRAVCRAALDEPGQVAVTARFDGAYTFEAAGKYIWPRLKRSRATASMRVLHPTRLVLGADRDVEVGESFEVTAASPGSGLDVPTGTVTFRAGSRVLCEQVPMRATGPFVSAPCATSVPWHGEHEITATYDGDGTFGRTTAATTVRARHATSVTPSTEPGASAVAGEPVVLKGRVLLAAPASVQIPAGETYPFPSGTVTFREGDRVLCEQTPTAPWPVVFFGMSMNIGFGATCPTRFAEPGVHEITVEYDGAPDFLPSTATFPVTVRRAAAPTTTSLTLEQGLGNQPTGLSALVEAPDGSEVSIGQVRFTVDGAEVCLTEVQARSRAAVATCPAPALALGDHTVVATYLGSAEAASSRSAPRTLSVRARGLSAGEHQTCASVSGRDWACWGGSGQPAPAGVFGAVSIDARYGCGLRTDKSVSCWGDGAPAPVGSFTAVDVGGAGPDQVGCGIRTGTGRVECWSRPSGTLAQPTTAPPGDGYVSVNVGPSRACALEPDGTPTCWGTGGEFSEQWMTQRFRQVSMGASGGCGIRLDQTLTCYGQQAPGAPTGSFDQVAAGRTISCARRPAGGVSCWRPGGVPTAVPAPSGTFESVTVGWDHACGVRSSGGVVCWGASSNQQDAVPAWLRAAG